MAVRYRLRADPIPSHPWAAIRLVTFAPPPGGQLRAVLRAVLWLALLAAWYIPGAWAAPPPTPLGVEETCARIGDKLSSVTSQECRERSLALSGGASVRGVPILIKEYPPLPGQTPLARVLLLGGIHGDEYSSVSIVFKWMQQLDRHHSGLFHWRLAPLTNPDGLLHRPSQRMNANGVDLNRNFPTQGWAKESADYWTRQTRRDPRRYPGKNPASEPETQWVVKEMERFRPDVVVSLHAPYNLLDFDGPPATPPKRFGNLTLSLLGTFPGSLGRFGWLDKQIPVVTIELNHAGILPTQAETQRIWMDLIRWLRHNAGPLKASDGPIGKPEQRKNVSERIPSDDEPLAGAP